MIAILADHNIEGQARILWGVVLAEGWHELAAMRFVEFADVGLPHETPDRMVWRFAQSNNMVLLTANRKMRGEDSLQRTIREENHSAALPVVTIARLDRIVEPAYRGRCAARLAEVVADIESYKGIGRVYIP
jgi:hypothetical protein